MLGFLNRDKVSYILAQRMQLFNTNKVTCYIYMNSVLKFKV